MNCAQIHEVLSQFVEQDLPEPEQAVVRTHLLACAGCRKELAELSALLRAVKEAPVPPVPPNLIVDINRRLDREQSSFGVRFAELFFSNLPAVRLATGVAVVLIAVGISRFIPHNSNGFRLSPDTAGGPEISIPRGETASSGTGVGARDEGGTAAQRPERFSPQLAAVSPAPVDSLHVQQEAQAEAEAAAIVNEFRRRTARSDMQSAPYGTETGARMQLAGLSAGPQELGAVPLLRDPVPDMGSAVENISGASPTNAVIQPVDLKTADRILAYRTQQWRLIPFSGVDATQEIPRIFASLDGAERVHPDTPGASGTIRRYQCTVSYGQLASALERLEQVGTVQRLSPLPQPRMESYVGPGGINPRVLAEPITIELAVALPPAMK